MPPAGVAKMRRALLMFTLQGVAVGGARLWSCGDDFARGAQVAIKIDNSTVSDRPWGHVRKTVPARRLQELGREARDSAVLPASQAAQVRERHFIERAFRGILSLDNQGPWPIVVGEEPTVYSRRLS